jgi:hypothetical protein
MRGCDNVSNHLQSIGRIVHVCVIMQGYCLGCLGLFWFQHPGRTHVREGRLSLVTILARSTNGIEVFSIGFQWLQGRCLISLRQWLANN